MRWCALLILLNAALVEGLANHRQHGGIRIAETDKHNFIKTLTSLSPLRGGSPKNQALETEQTVPMIRLCSIFSAHRFIAGSFGVLLLGFPSGDETNTTPLGYIVRGGFSLSLSLCACDIVLDVTFCALNGVV